MTTPAIVAVHVHYAPDLGGAIYTVAVPSRRGGPAKGETHVVEPWAAYSEAAAWCYAAMHAVLAAIEEGYTVDRLTIRGDYVGLGRLVGIDWDGQLGMAVLQYRAHFGNTVRFQHRGGDRLSTAEEVARTALYRSLLEEHRAESAA